MFPYGPLLPNKYLSDHLKHVITIKLFFEGVPDKNVVHCSIEHNGDILGDVCCQITTGPDAISVSV